ncbi:hypothetical protein EA472_18030 [Natrarchaeobius oligotrophus]|uniref:Uncharacterized protein n=2 Tax=Natrarchaeobius TaxID=2501796 RepID=A0A3N6NGY9_NATCH|nr:hypothetical protein EA472_18030 [Natrarchaeobius chitinivorans]
MMLGKTYSAGKLAADPSVDRPVTVLTNETDTREQVKDYAIEEGQDSDRIKMLPQFFEVCPTAAGEHDDVEIPYREETWSQLVEMLHSNQITPSYMHKRLDDAMPCQHEGKCPYAVACDFEIDNVDLLIGHPIHGNVERYIEERVTIFDEDAGGAFEYTVEQDAYTRAINVLLEHHVDLDGATSIDDLIAADDDQRAEWIAEIHEQVDLTDPNVGYSDQGGRADAPLLAIAVLNGEPVADDGSLNMRRTELASKTLLYDEGTDTTDPSIIVRTPPEPLASAWATIAMDGTPTPEIWCNRLGLDLEYHEFMTLNERAEFIEHVLDYNIVQLTPDRTVSAAKAKNLNRDVFNGILWEIKNEHDRMLPTITSNEAKQSIINGRYVSNKELHLGKVRSHSELEDETLLAVLGSLHPGDREIQRLAALDGYAVESNGEPGIDKSYGKVGDKYYRHLVHNEVAQAIFRVGRTEEIPGADIYVYTANIPDWIPRTVVEENPKRWSRSVQEVARALEERGSATKDEIIDSVSVKKRSVDEALKVLRKHGYVEDERGDGRYAKKEWKNVGLSEKNPHANVPIPDR